MSKTVAKIVLDPHDYTLKLINVKSLEICFLPSHSRISITSLIFPVGSQSLQYLLPGSLGKKLLTIVIV